MEPLPEQVEYWPIYFVDPYEGNENALGLDLKFAVTGGAVTKARDAGLTHLSAPILLVQETKKLPGVVLYVPYYRGTLPEEPTVDDRRAAFLGVFQLVFRGEDMFSKLLDSEIIRQTERLPRPMPTDEDGRLIPSAPGNLLYGGLDFAVVDRGNDATNKVLFFRPAPMRKVPTTMSAPEQFDSALRTSRTVHFAGRHWELLLHPCPEYLAANATMHPYGAMISGLAFTLLFAAYTMTLQRRSREVERTCARHNPQSSLNRLCELVATRLRIDRVSIWQLDENGKTLCCTNSYDLKTGGFEHGRSTAVEDLSDFLFAVETEPILLCRNITDDERLSQFRTAGFAPSGVHSAIIGSNRQSGQLEGVVCWCAQDQARECTREDESLAKTVVDAVALIWAEADRAQTESRLRDSERLYHSLVENLPQYVFRKDLQGRFTFVNQQLAEAHNRTMDSMLGLTDEDLTLGNMAEKFRHDDERVIKTGETWSSWSSWSWPSA